MASLSRSPLAPDHFPTLPLVNGVTVRAGYAGARYPAGRDDLLIVTLAPGTTLAGVFTRSQTASPVVRAGQAALADSGGQCRALLVTAGNSFAGTGQQGAQACTTLAGTLADLLECPTTQVQIGATGVIGEPPPTQKLVEALPAVLTSPPCSWEQAARAILTTDTFPKGATRTAWIDGVPVQLVGFIKGSGMIAPNMATMLGYLFTDAAIPAPLLQALLTQVVATTFNCITVDSDTSTSDTILLAATGTAPHAPLTAGDTARLADFTAALHALCLDLAQQVVRDGEGAQKFITITVSGAASAEDARILGLSIANSPLIKTALGGGDANWGRIVMAVGKAGPLINPDRLRIAFGDTVICAEGQRVTDYDEAPVAAHLAGRDLMIAVDVGVGDATMTVYTCDLTHGYIDINTDYRS